MSPVAKQYTRKKVAAVARLKIWRRHPLRRAECESVAALVERERAVPGSCWPPRPRERYRQPLTRSPLTRQLVDLVQEHIERGAQGLVMKHADVADLTGYSSRMVQYALAEARRLELLEQVPCFEPLDEAKPTPRHMARATRRHRHGERAAAFLLGPAVIAAIAHADERRRRPPGWAERMASAERAREARKLRDFTPQSIAIRSEDLLPEEASGRSTDARCTSAEGASRRPIGAPPSQTTSSTERFSPGHSDDPTTKAPPLELRDSWSRMAAAPPPRNDQAISGERRGRPPNTSPKPPGRPALASDAKSRGPTAAAPDPFSEALAAFRARVLADHAGDDHDGGD